MERRQPAADPRDQDKRYKETPAEEMTEANRHAKLSCSKQLLNDVICIWFSDDKKLYQKKSQIDRLHGSAATKNKHGAKRLLRTRTTVTDGVSKLS